MIDLEHSVLIDRPVDEVFAYVADQTNEPKWHTDVLEVRPAGPVQLGSSLTQQIKFMGTSEYVLDVTAFEPLRRIELTTRQGALKPTLTHTFEDAGGRTRYTRHVQIPLQGVFRFLGPVMKATGAADRRNARFAENLKAQFE